MEAEVKDHGETRVEEGELEGDEVEEGGEGGFDGIECAHLAVKAVEVGEEGSSSRVER